MNKKKTTWHTYLPLAPGLGKSPTILGLYATFVRCAAEHFALSVHVKDQLWRIGLMVTYTQLNSINE
jgi:hypothetical protein